MAKRDGDPSPSRPAKKAQAVKTPATKPKGGAEIREAVIAAAERLFRDRSPAKVTLREIAAEAGVQQSLVYRYFRTKETLIASVFYPQVRLIQTAVVEAPDVRLVRGGQGREVEGPVRWQAGEGETRRRPRAHQAVSEQRRHRRDDHTRGPRHRDSARRPCTIGDEEHSPEHTRARPSRGAGECAARTQRRRSTARLIRSRAPVPG
jgi:AcrR family transcriptional regulator